MRKRHEPSQKGQIVLDAAAEKRGRGRPQKIPRTWVTGTAENYRMNLAEVWATLSSPLLTAKSQEQVIVAFENHAQPYAQRFVPRLAADIMALIRDPTFPKRAKAQIGFLADSLSGRPNLTARTSRDICAKHRANVRAQSPYKIIRHEFYVECSCGYKGPGRDNACLECGAPIPIDLSAVFGNSRLF